MRPRKLLNILPLGVVQTSQAVVGFEHYVVGGGWKAVSCGIRTPILGPA